MSCVAVFGRPGRSYLGRPGWARVIQPTIRGAQPEAQIGRGAEGQRQPVVDEPVGQGGHDGGGRGAPKPAVMATRVTSMTPRPPEVRGSALAMFAA